MYFFFDFFKLLFQRVGLKFSNPVSLGGKMFQSKLFLFPNINEFVVLKITRSSFSGFLRRALSGIPIA